MISFERVMQHEIVREFMAGGGLGVHVGRFFREATWFSALHFYSKGQRLNIRTEFTGLLS